MELVVDANVLFSSLIKDGVTRNLLFDDRLQLYTPEYIFQEIFEHIAEIEMKTHSKRKKIIRIIQQLLTESDMRIISLHEMKAYREYAKQISPDPKDIPYVAAALKLNCAIWSNDKELQTQKRIKVYSTKDLMAIL
jgi:predicted nucleic acid-binding protein